MNALGSWTLGALMVGAAALPWDVEKQVEELGQVHWERDHAGAFSRAQAEHKPVLLLFQEIPG